MKHFTLYSRSYCHLCDDLLAARAAGTSPPNIRALIKFEIATAALLWSHYFGLLLIGVQQLIFVVVLLHRRRSGVPVKALALGADGFCIKPVERAWMLERLTALIERSEPLLRSPALSPAGNVAGMATTADLLIDSLDRVRETAHRVLGNLIGNAEGSEGLGVTTNQLGTAANPIDPRIGALRNNGGATLTRALQNRSPAIDKGNSPAITTDQRGRTRPYDDPKTPNAAGGNAADTGIEFGVLSRLLSRQIVSPPPRDVAHACDPVTRQVGKSTMVLSRPPSLKYVNARDGA
mgnify:CR=1 FL=1